MVDGTHHSCWLLLQALFMIARVLTANNTTAVRTIAKGVFIVTSLLRVSPKTRFIIAIAHRNRRH